MKITRDQSYGPHERDRADIYQSSGARNETVIIFWHGGSWQRGDKRWYRFMGRSLARMGYTAVIPNYRLYPEVAWPVFAEDAARATAWVNREFKPKRLIAMGHSAGAQIAATVAFDHRYLAAAKVTRQYDGFIGLAGAYSFTPGASLRPVLETGDRLWQTPGVIGDNPVPSLLVHGLVDTIVAASSTRRLDTALRAHGGVCETIYYPHMTHFTVLVPFVVGWWYLPSLRRRLARFLNSL